MPGERAPPGPLPHRDSWRCTIPASVLLASPLYNCSSPLSQILLSLWLCSKSTASRKPSLMATDFPAPPVMSCVIIWLQLFTDSCHVLLWPVSCSRKT